MHLMIIKEGVNYTPGYANHIALNSTVIGASGGCTFTLATYTEAMSKCELVMASAD